MLLWEANPYLIYTCNREQKKGFFLRGKWNLWGIMGLNRPSSQSGLNHTACGLHGKEKIADGIQGLVPSSRLCSIKLGFLRSEMLSIRSLWGGLMVTIPQNSLVNHAMNLNTARTRSEPENRLFLCVDCTEDCTWEQRNWMQRLKSI